MHILKIKTKDDIDGSSTLYVVKLQTERLLQFILIYGKYKKFIFQAQMFITN